MPQISIIIPVYKVEKYLPACLDSVLAQTVQDWEAICVNDGSPDKCGEILKKYAKKDKRIKVIVQKNLGISVARNNALKQVKGDYICFLDSDDELNPTFFEKMLKSLEETGADVASCDYQQGTQKVKWPQNNLAAQSYTNVFDVFLAEKVKMGACIWNKMYKANLLKGLRFSKELGIGEDLFFLYQVLYKAQKAVVIPAVLYFYRVRKNSAMNSGLSPKIVLGNIKTAELLSDYFKTKELSPKTRKILDKKIAKRIFKFSVLEPKRKDKKNLKKWYALTHPLLKKLKQQGIYQPKYLTLKNRLKSWWFLRGK
ncbi:MAG: glycosyltransferase family 2 protein [Alphaproteobacteria bacterium]|nr:glycosyltransferase family 2 protein [Alphaproteobacteria bacterium]